MPTHTFASPRPRRKAVVLSFSASSINAVPLGVHVPFLAMLLEAPCLMWLSESTEHLTICHSTGETPSNTAWRRKLA